MSARNPMGKRAICAAYHEAGHVVMAAALIGTPDRVTIESGRGFHGRTFTRVVYFSNYSLPLQMFLAGPAAAHLHASKLPEHIAYWSLGDEVLERIGAGDTDIGEALQCVRKLGFGETYDRKMDCLMRHYAIVRDCLRSTWPAVESVASALLEKVTLERDDILETLDAHDIYSPVFALQRAYDIPGFEVAA